MAENQATQIAPQERGHAAVPARETYLEWLPQPLAADSYARYLASECDRLTAERNTEREGRYAAEAERTEQVFEGVRAAIRAVEREGELKQLRAQLTSRWTAGQVTELVFRIALTVMVVAFLAMLTITAVV